MRLPKIEWEAGAGAFPAVQPILRGLPPLAGRPVLLSVKRGLGDRHGPVHAGTFLRERRILFDCTRAEFPRILVHELFHFVWLRAGNPARISFERLIDVEIDGRARGELGWAAESHKLKLKQADRLDRTRLWREYCCESFCDTAAWLYSGVAGHAEFTLGSAWRQRRRAWFERTLAGRELPI